MLNSLQSTNTLISKKCAGIIFLNVQCYPDPEIGKICSSDLAQAECSAKP